MNEEPVFTDKDVQAIMESLFDIRQGVTLLVAELIGEDDDDGPGEEEED